MAPSAKRKRRNVLPPSSPPTDDDEEEPVSLPNRKLVDLISSSPPPPPRVIRRTMATNASAQPNAVPAKLKPRARIANHPSNAAPIHLPTGRVRQASNRIVGASPEKPKYKINMDEKGKSGNIFTLFTKQAQRQQTEATNRRTKSNLQGVEELQAEDVDMISDNEVLESKAQPASAVGQAARKRARIAEPSKDHDASIPSGSQRYMMNIKPAVGLKSEDDLRPWAERFAPIDLEELAVHKKKVSDVRGWLENVMDGKMRQRLLILQGAAGTAKTTTVQLLAKSMNCKVLEWRNPVGSMATEVGFQSMSAQFEEFMGRGGRFGQLDIFSSNGTVQSKPDIKPLDRRKNIILVEEFPNTFTKSSTPLQSFRSAILQYLASTTPPFSMMYNHTSKDPITPVVMIISETLLTTTSASADSFTAHRLLGPEILQHPGVATIEFNAIAPTLLAKALELIVKKEAKKSGRRKTPGPLVLQRLGEIGDVRSAVGSLEFLCLRGDVDGDWGSKVAFGKVKKCSKEVSLTRMEEESLELVTRREASLGIFHAVGKVVYNKRDEIFPSSIPKEVEKLPDFMSLHCRPRRSQVMVDELIDETGTDTQTFVAALHENYILSCDAPPTSFDVSTLDHVNGCIDALSDSDLLCPSWNGSLDSSGFGGGSGGRGSSGDIMRRDEISFQIAVRGILFALPCPVKRQAPAAGGLRMGGWAEANKMFFPTSLKLWRMKEEIESSIDLWIVRLMKGEVGHLSAVTAGANMFARPKAGSVESWKSARAPQGSQNGKEAVSDATPLLSVGTLARKEMLLERLPHMVSIARAKSRRNASTTSMLAVRDMEKVTTFRGIGVMSDENADEDDEEGGVGEQWATDENVDGIGKSPRKKSVVARMVARGNGKMGGGLGLTAQMEQKLVLSDDDIEDD